MSMRGDVTSAEYQRIVFVRDDKGGEFACYAKDLKDPKHVSDNEKKSCLDTSQIVGDNW